MIQVHILSCILAGRGWDMVLSTYLLVLASFPGLPRFFCSSVCVDDNTQMRKSAFVYHCQRKPKNRKNGVGLGMRLYLFINRACVVLHILGRKSLINYFPTLSLKQQEPVWIERLYGHVDSHLAPLVPKVSSSDLQRAVLQALQAGALRVPTEYDLLTVQTLCEKFRNSFRVDLHPCDDMEPQEGIVECSVVVNYFLL